MSPPMYDSMKYPDPPYKGNIGKGNMGYNPPYQGTLKHRGLGNDRQLYKGTIKPEGYDRENTRKKYKEYQLPEDYYGTKRNRRRYPAQPKSPKRQAYNPGYARQQPVLDKQRYEPAYATAQTRDRTMVETSRYVPEYASRRLEDRQIVYNENRYAPVNAQRGILEREVLGPTPYRPEEARLRPEDRTVYQPSNASYRSWDEPIVPLYTAPVASRRTEDRTMQGPSRRSIEAASPVYNMREYPTANSWSPAPIVPVVAAGAAAAPIINNNNKKAAKKPDSKGKNKVQPQADNIVEAPATQRMWSQPVVAEPVSQVAKTPKPPQTVSNKNKLIPVMAATTLANKPKSKRKPSRQAPTAADSAPPFFPPVSPERPAAKSKDNSPRFITPDPMRFDSTYKEKPEPMFPPLIPVSVEDYAKNYRTPRSPKGRGKSNPLVPWVVPSLGINKQPPRYESISPDYLDSDDDRYPYNARYSNVPSYNAMGTVMRSMQVHGY